MKKGLIYAIITALVFTTLEPVSKLIANDVAPYAITFWRFLIGAIILIPFAIIKIKKEKIHITLKDFGIMTLMGGFFICVIMILLQAAIKTTPSPAITSMVFSTNSVLTIIFSSFILKDKITKNRVTAIILCSAGILICTDFSSGTNFSSTLMAVGAALTFSLYTVFSKKYMARVGGIIQTAFTFFLGSIILLIALLVLRVDVSFPTDNIKTISILIYLGVLVTGIGYWSYFKGIEKGGAIIGSLAFFIKPILTPFVTMFVNGIMPNASVVSALILIVIGSYFALYKKEITGEGDIKK